ncbi:MAG: hypothetical protein KJ630_13035 [Proteobacteria bacterium]|nr:hypothetical protein [Pseudomonadota bacterium]
MDNNKTFEDNLLWDGIYQKVGRCVVLFQKIELLFKYAVTRGCFSLVVSTNPSKIAPIDQLKNNANSLSQKTMGCVGRLFCDRILTDNIYSTDDKELSKDEIRLNVSIKFGTNEQQISWKNKIESIITERNKLVHHLFNTFGFNTKEEFSKAGIYLDDIYNDALSLYNELTELTNFIPELIKNGFSNIPNIFVINDLYNTPFEKELIVMMQYYAELRIKFKNSDGWTNLADTGTFLSKQCPAALKECKTKHKTKSLKIIIEKFGLFEIKSTGENKQNITFRIKPDYWIEKDTENQLFICKKLPDSDGYIKDDLGMSLVNEPTTTNH